MSKKISAIVLAAGHGRRMKNDGIAKQFMDLNGFPILFFSLKAFEDSKVDNIIIVTGEDMTEYVKCEIVDKYSIGKCTAIVKGGAERFDSVLCGLEECDKQGADYVLIHDGARPLIETGQINEIIWEVQETGAVIAASKSKDTVKLADSDGYVISTPDRNNVWNVQTPQAFSFPLVYKAYKEAVGETFTDDASVVEAKTAHKVKLYDCGYKNIKITTPEDIDIAKGLL